MQTSGAIRTARASRASPAGTSEVGVTQQSSLKRLSRLSVLYAIADMVSRGSAILLVPLYARYMAPGEYGVLALASLATSLLVMLLSFGGQSVVQRFYNQYDDPAERARFLGAFWLFLVTVPGVALALLWAVGGAAVPWLFPSLAAHPFLEMVLGISYLNVAFGTVLPSLFRAREQGLRYLALSLATMLVTVGLSAYFVAVLGLGAAGALGAQVGGLLAVAPVSCVMLLRELSPGWRKGMSVMNWLRSLRRQEGVRSALRYGLPLVPHFAAHWTLSISDRAIVGRFAGLGSVGVYSLAYQFGTVLQMLISSVNGALMPVFSRAAKDKRQFDALPRLATYYFLVVASLGLAVALTAKDVIMLLTPPEYHDAGALVPFIILGVVAMGFYFMPMNALSMTAGKTAVIPLITTLAGAANVGLNLLLVPRLGPLGAAINTAIGYGLLALLTTLYARRIVPLKYEADRLAKIALSAVLLFVAGQWLRTQGAILDLLLGLTLVTAMPAVLWLLGFWTEGEKRVVAQLVRPFTASFRTNRRGD